MALKDQTMKVLDDGKVYKVQKVRQRKIHSCVQCHSKKIKCSRDHPICTNCSKANLECKYFINERVSRGRKKVSSSLDKVKLVNLQSPPSESPAVLSVSNSPSPNDDDDTKMISPASTPPNLASKGDSGSNTNLMSLFNNDFMNDISNDLNNNLNNASVHATASNVNISGENRNESSNSMSTMSDSNKVGELSMNQVNTSSRDSNSAHKLSNYSNLSIHNLTNMSNFSDFHEYMKLPNTTTSPEVLYSYLPTKERSSELLNRYINSVHILIPLIDITEFVGIHDKYWNNTTKSNLSSNLQSNFEFYLILFPILYGSCISEFEEYDNLLLYQEIEKYSDGFKLMNQIYNYPNNTSIPLLQANLMVQSTSFNPSPLQMSTIIRYAQNLKFDRDPLSYHKYNNAKEIQSRRLIWWQIFSLDSLSALNFCLVPQISVYDFDTLLPVEVINNKLNYSILCLNANFRYSVVLNEIVRQINGMSETLTQNDLNLIKFKLVELHKSIHNSISKMNSNFNIAPPYNNVKQLNFIQFVKNYIGSFVDRALLLFHKKILIVREDNSNYNSVSKTDFEENLLSNLIESAFIDKKFNKVYKYDDLSDNLLPSILHNLNDFINYNDFIKFGKFNWYIKRTIPVDSIIFLISIISIKFKSGKIIIEELNLFNNLINKSLFILNKNWFKSEKYRRMLSLINSTWKFIVDYFQINKLLYEKNYSALNPFEINNSLIVPKPLLKDHGVYNLRDKEMKQLKLDGNAIVNSSNEIEFEETQSLKTLSDDLNLAREKIRFNLDNNFVYEMDYCEIFRHLERILKKLMDYLSE